MQPDDKKAGELKQLFSFCMQTEVTGFTSNVWFDCLARRYPWQFLSFTKMFGTHNAKRSSFDKKIGERFEATRDFILMAPLSHDERILMETMLNEFETIVKRGDGS